jgi:uncharacterized membrane protein
VPSGRGTRRTYIDWARGLAVLIMIQAHVLDAWTLRSERTSALFAFFNLLGGMAAPLFLWLAGLSVVMAGEQRRLRLGSRSAAGDALVRRGLEIFALAFLFRLQAFIVSPGNPLVSLLRVDILNIMGPALVGAALLWRTARGLRGVMLLTGGAATIIAMLAPIARTHPWAGFLPPFLQWYVSPAGNHSTFTIFPWSGFVFAGAAAGALLMTAPAEAEAKPLRMMAVVGLLLVVGCYAASLRPSIYTTASFWTTSPTYFGLRVGVLMLVLAGLRALAPLASSIPAASAVLARFGRHSLFVYWIHVELVYGYATALVHQRLPLWGTGLGFIAFSAAMYWAIALRDRVVAWWQAGLSRHPAAETLRA